MFARSALRIAGRRVARPAAVQTPVFRASFNNSAKNADPEVHVASFAKGQRKVESIEVPASGNGPVAPPGADEKKVAIPFKKDGYSHLTPTLAKFTCPDKVAVITG